MKRTLYTIFLLMIIITSFAQSYPRKCTEEDIATSERNKYYTEAERHIINYYMLIPAAIGDIENRDVIIEDVMADTQAVTLKTEFLLLGVNNLSFVSPAQYFAKLENEYMKMADVMDFVVDNFKHESIMMKTGTSCYIPTEYDLILQKEGQILFKRRCRMLCFFPRLSASKLIKTMQVEPLYDITIYKKSDNNIPLTGNNQSAITRTYIRGDITDKSILDDNEMHYYQNDYEYVDLGLSVYWATCNLGASAPGEGGEYFAWGETSPKLKYIKNNSVTYKKKIDKVISGNIYYDAATSTRKSPWRIPTKEEFQELIDKCSWLWDNAKKGYKIIGPNGNFIFLPARGWKDYKEAPYTIGGGYNGTYWSANPFELNLYNYKKRSHALYFFGSDKNTTCYVSSYERYLGYNIRPVISKNKQTFICLGNVVAKKLQMDYDVFEPVIGATIEVAYKKNKYAVSDIDGAFKIEDIVHGDKLIIKMIGFKTKIVEWKKEWNNIPQKFILHECRFRTHHSVEKGETLNSICKLYKISLEQLKDANPELRFKKYLYIGYCLNIP